MRDASTHRRLYTPAAGHRTRGRHFDRRGHEEEVPEADGAHPPWLGPDLILGWSDGNAAVQESFDFVLEIRSVDIAGNVGDPVEVAIEDGGGCSCAQPGTPAQGSFGIALAWLLRRRRQLEAGASSSAGSPSRSAQIAD